MNNMEVIGSKPVVCVEYFLSRILLTIKTVLDIKWFTDVTTKFLAIYALSCGFYLPFVIFQCLLLITSSEVNKCIYGVLWYLCSSSIKQK